MKRIASRTIAALIGSTAALIVNSLVGEPAYPAASGWVKDVCGKPDTPAEFIRTCWLMAAAMNAPTPDEFAKVIGDPNRIIPISLKCPSSKDEGTIELVSKNRLGESERLVVAFKSGRSVRVEPSQADKNSPFRPPWIVLNADGETNAERRRAFSVYAARVVPLKTEVCEGNPQAKKRFFDMLDANREALRDAGR